MTRTAPTKQPSKTAVVKPAPNRAQPPQPVTKRDTLDVDRADAEGMAQPQGKPPQDQSLVPSQQGNLQEHCHG
jgi:hypothetical protein